MADVDFIEEIRIAQYWRKQLGEYEYVYFNPDDLRRWFIALETRGPTEMRAYLTERTGRYPMSVVTGIVSTAPHPPLSVVELWLASHEHTSTKPYWTAAGATFLAIWFIFTNLQGCSNLTDLNRLDTHPPQMSPPIQAAAPGAQPAQAASTLPQPGPAPAAVASPPATSSSSRTH